MRLTNMYEIQPEIMCGIMKVRTFDAILRDDFDAFALIKCTKI